MLEVSKIPKAIRNQLRKVAHETPSIHLVCSVLYGVLFVASIVTQQYGNVRYDADMTNQRYSWTSSSENTLVNYVHTKIPAALILWIGSLVAGVWHFVHWLIWGKSFGNLNSLKTKFARQFEISSRWWIFVIVETFLYVVITCLFINFDSFVIAARVLISIGISALFFSFDRINRPYLIESLSDEPVELKGFTDVKKVEEGADQADKTNPDDNEVGEVVHRFFKLDLCTFGIAAAMSVTMWFFFIYRLYNAEGFSNAPAFFKCVVWFFPFFNCLTIVSSLLAYLKPSAISHIRSSTLFYSLNFVTFASVAVTSLIGLYASY